MRYAPGLYEQVITNALSDELSDIDEAQKSIAPIDKAEASRVLSSYLAEILKQSLDHVADNGGDIAEQVNLVNDIINLIFNTTHEPDFAARSIERRAGLLLALLQKNDPLLAAGRKASDIVRPETSIAHSSLFTGAEHEPQMYTELKKEIVSSDRIDMLVSFIKWSGLRLVMNELREFPQKGGELRVITTSYMGATDIKAIEELKKLINTRIKVSYNTKRTRLHAKAYIFYRNTGFTTAYVGSSNLSNAALSGGLEWNTKITQKDLPETINKIEGTFNFYWNDQEFEYYAEEQKERLIHALKSEKYIDSENKEYYTLDIRPYAYQQEILDKLEAERQIRGFAKNLVVAATGTGKTVISALDYKRFCKQNADKNHRLLFVAHREEILRQSLYTFRAVLKDANFGDLFIGHCKPDNAEHLFISVQTFNSQKFYEKTPPDFYDYIIIDEFHHAAAPTYQKLLEYYRPMILLGLTATPERMDGKSILPYFDGRIAAEIRLPEAIDRKLLCPFHYFGVTDSVDLRALHWNAAGYDKEELSKIYTMNEVVACKRADLVIGSLVKYVTDMNDVKGLGFCVSVEHANFMANFFNKRGIPSKSVTGQTDEKERKAVKKLLAAGRIHFLFVVDIYNEGVDIPEVNTILFLRPTESLTVFLQQLGRGLRLCDGKDCLTVLDFIGQAHKRYNFENKFSALLTHVSRGIIHEIKKGFISAPKGCYIQLEKMATRYILNNVRASYGNRSFLLEQIKNFTADTGLECTPKNFLNYHHIDPRTVYKYASFSRLCADAGIIENFSDPAENIITKALARFAVVDSRRWIIFLTETLPRLKTITSDELSALPDGQQRMMQMFYVSVWGNTAQNWYNSEVLHNLRTIAGSPVIFNELIVLLQYRYECIDFVDHPFEAGFDCPLDIYCTYSRDQILTALDFMKPSSVREGVKWLPEKNTDVLFVTLNKSDKDYSPTTMYNDYSVNETLFHWQSQSTTAETSPTGQRYIHHAKQGSRVLLFVREYKTDTISSGAAAYTFLGPAAYVSHRGSRPMNITWRLLWPIPAKFLKKTSKLMVG